MFGWRIRSRPPGRSTRRASASACSRCCLLGRCSKTLLAKTTSTVASASVSRLVQTPCTTSTPGTRVAPHIGTGIKGDSPAAIDLVDELAVSRSDVEDGVPGLDVALEEAPAEDAPDTLPSLLLRRIEPQRIQAWELHRSRVQRAAHVKAKAHPARLYYGESSPPPRCSRVSRGHEPRSRRGERARHRPGESSARSRCATNPRRASAASSRASAWRARAPRPSARSSLCQLERIRKNSQDARKGPDAGRRPQAAREA